MENGDGTRSCITHVHISADEENRKKIASLHKMITDVFDSEEVKIGRESWQEQFISALSRRVLTFHNFR